MRTYLIILIASGLFLGCTKDYAPDSYLSAQEQYDQMWKIIRYLGKPPENLTFEERFYKGYDSYYEKQIAAHRLDAYFIDDSGTHYFLVSRRAPSLVEKRVATGGKMKLDAEGTLTEYEEVFRTWKMVDSLQVSRSLFLFDKMVKGQSLEPYLTKNSMPEEYIEFPDDRVYFDKEKRQWIAKPLE